MTNTAQLRDLARLRWAEARRAIDHTDYDAFADLGSEANRRLMSFVLGGMFVLGGLVGMGAVLPHHQALGIPLPVALIAGPVLVLLGVAQISLPARSPMWELDAIVATAVALTSVGLAALDQQVGGYVILFYLWPMVGIITLRSSRAALLHFGWIAVTSGAVFVFDDTFSSPAFWWIVVILTLGTVWHTVGWLVRRTRALASREHDARRRAESATVALREVGEQKSRFLASMSHELRTPMNAIIGFGEMLQRRVAGPLNDRQAEYVDDIVESGRHLCSLIDDTLDAAKIESGVHALDPVEVDVADLVEEAVRFVRGRAASTGVEVTTDPGSVKVLECDRRKIKQVLVNLLANAVKFTPSGGAVAVAARRAPEGVIFSVRDTGPGIDPAHHRSIFEEYRQTDDATCVGEGTGLGLAVARQLVQVHGGEIWVRSRPGEGATFSFLVPDGADGTTGGEKRDVDGDGTSASDVLSARDLVGRGAVFVTYTAVGGLAGALLVDTPGVDSMQLWGAVAFSSALLVAIGCVLRFTTERSLLVLGMVLLGIAATATAVGVHQLGPLAATSAVVWIGEAFLVRFIGVRLGLRAGWYYVVFVGLAFALILAVQPGNDAPVGQWLVVVSSVWVGSFVASWLIRAVEGLATAERSEADRALRTMTELENVSRHKSQFLAGMSHELRTPLNAVIGFTDMLEREIVGPLTERQQAYVGDIGDAGRGLLALINGVLELAKIDAGHLNLRPAPTDVASLVRLAGREAAVAAAAKGVDLRIDVDRGSMVVVDARHIAQAVAGLLSNAVKFTPTGGEVSVTSRQDRRTTCIMVTDTGPGVAAAEHETVFEAFHQLDGDPTRPSEGAGLSLALARRLVEAHGGSLLLDSAPGRGATFTVTLPRTPVPPRNSQAAASAAAN